jgi:hypothetical protein
MIEEFKKIGVNTVTSSKGFTVQVKPMGVVLYRDANGEVEIDSEWLVKPPRILLYKNKKTFDMMDQSLFDSMFSNVARALEYLGHQVEGLN